MSLLDDFKARFPEFPPETVDEVIPRLEPSFIYWYGYPYDTSTTPNNQINNAILYLAAHLYVVDQKPSPAQINQFANNAVGNVSGSFRMRANASDFISFFSATKYGQQYLQIINSRRGGCFV